MDSQGAVIDGVCFETEGGHSLAGLYTAAAPAGPAAVLCHGILSSKESDKLVQLAARLARLGISSLRFDFSGRGQSGGDPARILYSQEALDLAAAVALVRERGHTRVGLFGSSMGGAVVILHAARDPAIAAVATLAAVARPALFLERTPPERVAAWREQGFFVYDGARISAAHLDDAARTDVLGAARTLRMPVLVQHGALDTVVPVRDGELLAAATGGELVVYPEGDHRFSRPEELEAALARVVAFLTRHLGTA
jgi:fermentation-respiration switch protein FrsA (DUF1100 family)